MRLYANTNQKGKRRPTLALLQKKRKKDQLTGLRRLSLQIQQTNPELFNLIQKLGDKT